MKSIIKNILLYTTVITLLSACSKVDSLPVYQKGTTPVVTASATSVAPLAADSTKPALTVSWTFPNYATTPENMKYVVEIDSTGKNFSSSFSRTVNGNLSTVFTAKELNDMLLAKGYAFNVPVDMDIRVTSSYSNNNEQLGSNTIKVKMTPYKIPPKVALPASGRLFIVGDATDFGWSNDAAPAFPATREFTRIDETTFGGIFNLKGSGVYKFLQKQGEWSSQFHMIAGGTSSGGSFEQKDADPAFPSPAAGLYKIIVDFQTGKFSVMPFNQQHGLPTDLFIVGDATPGDWSNPVPVPSQQFTRKTSTQFEIASLALTSGKKYLLLPENGNWGKKFGGDGSATNTKLSGTFKPEGADMLSPDVSGNYKITVDFINNSYKLVKL